MKKYILITLGLIMVACQTEEKTPPSLLETVSNEPLYQTKYNALLLDNSNDEYMGNILNPIRQKVKRQEENNFELDSTWTSDSKTIKRYQNEMGDTKITVRSKKPNETRNATYYFHEHQVILVSEKIYETTLKEADEYYEGHTDSLFVQNNKVVRIISTMDCGAPFSQEYRDEETGRLNANLEFLNALE